MNQTAFFCFYFVVVEKRVWWISIGSFVLQTPRFWELLIGVDNYKGPFNEVRVTSNLCICLNQKDTNNNSCSAITNDDLFRIIRLHANTEQTACDENNNDTHITEVTCTSLKGPF